MTKSTSVTITYYRWEGHFLWFRAKARCAECDLAYVVLNQLMNTVFAGKPVRLSIRPWLDNWWRIIWRGAWHAPVVMLDGHVFSQGRVPDVAALIRAVGKQLGDPAIETQASAYAQVKRLKPRAQDVPIVYHSPTCPHCTQMCDFLDVNAVAYEARDVSASEVALRELKALTGRLAIPVAVLGERRVEGFNKEQLCALVGLAPEACQETSADPDNARCPVLEVSDLRKAIVSARRVLEENRFDGQTRASKHLYPHQWNWDAGFIARGYLRFDPNLACAEMAHLFGAQWNDGFLPHIVFNPKHLEHFPGPDYWQAERSGRVPSGVHTSGITQPPVHATMLAPALSSDLQEKGAPGFLQFMYPRLCRLHEFLHTKRTMGDNALIALVHPWESGIDNAPIWDEPLANVTDSSPWAHEMQERYNALAETGDRPKRSYIEKYSFLVESLYSRKYDWSRIMAEHPFRVEDVLFNSVLCQAERDLAAMAVKLGESPEPHLARADAIADAMNAKLWHEGDGLYYSYDAVAEQHVCRDTVFSYIPLFAGIPDATRAQRLIENLKTHCFCLANHDCVGIPSYDMCQADYNGEFYWRGPVWYNMCWYMIHGLRRYNAEAEAQWLEDSMLKLVVDEGFYEYYEPLSGTGLGADGFSWTAALFLDLAVPRVTSCAAPDAEGVCPLS